MTTEVGFYTGGVESDEGARAFYWAHLVNELVNSYMSAVSPFRRCCASREGPLSPKQTSSDQFVQGSAK